MSEHALDRTEAKRLIEALLFVTGGPVTLKRMREVLPAYPVNEVDALVAELQQEYTASRHAFCIQEVAGGYQLVTDRALASWIQRALNPQKPSAVSQAALETLAIVAYRQPITKAEIETIRGVDITASLDTLLQRQFIHVAGRKETPGRPFLYGTTTEFLRHFGLKSLEGLPTLHLPTISEPVAGEVPAHD